MIILFLLKQEKILVLKIIKNVFKWLGIKLTIVLFIIISFLNIILIFCCLISFFCIKLFLYFLLILIFYICNFIYNNLLKFFSNLGELKLEMNWLDFFFVLLISFLFIIRIFSIGCVNHSLLDRGLIMGSLLC